MKEKVPTKLLVLLALIIFGIAGYFSYQQWKRHRSIQGEIASLEAERERVSKENESLKERIGYFGTDNYQEQESKERLSMRKPDEYVVEIDQPTTATSEGSAEQPQVDDSASGKPDYMKWFEKIFKSNL